MPMVLSRVVYEFFDFEQPSIDTTELSRQIQLHFHDVPALFVSWSFERRHDLSDEPYSIGFARASYFVGDADVVIDASRSLLWSKHVGREVQLEYMPSERPDYEYQALALSSDAGRLYLYSMGVDTVSLAEELPEYAARALCTRR